MVVDELRDVLDLLRARPDLVEGLEVGGGQRSLVDLVDQVRDRVASLVPEVCRREALERHVGSAVVDDGELLHGCAGLVGLEGDLPLDPVGALPGDRSLSELVAQPDLELRPVEARLALSLRDIELPTFLLHLVGGLASHERRRGEDELQFPDAFQFFAERLECVDGERRRRDSELGAAREGDLDVVSESLVEVVDDLHQRALFGDSRSEVTPSRSAIMSADTPGSVTPRRLVQPDSFLAQATEWSSKRRPRALVTLRMVDQVGLPSAESAL